MQLQSADASCNDTIWVVTEALTVLSYETTKIIDVVFTQSLATSWLDYFQL